MDAIVIAGGIPQPQDPLYTYSQGDSKALIDIAGKPMIQWVLDALSGARQVDNVILVGFPPRVNLFVKSLCIMFPTGANAGKHCGGSR